MVEGRILHARHQGLRSARRYDRLAWGLYKRDRWVLRQEEIHSGPSSIPSSSHLSFTACLWVPCPATGGKVVSNTTIRQQYNTACTNSTIRHYLVDEHQTLAYWFGMSFTSEIISVIHMPSMWLNGVLNFCRSVAFHRMCPVCLSWTRFPEVWSDTFLYLSSARIGGIGIRYLHVLVKSFCIWNASSWVWRRGEKRSSDCFSLV